jgi:hypothetical protein
MAEVGAIYRCWKNGHDYQVIGIGKHSETLEDLIIYKALRRYDDFPEGQLWCRPAKMWEEIKNGKPRFEKVP